MSGATGNQYSVGGGPLSPLMQTGNSLFNLSESVSVVLYHSGVLFSFSFILACVICCLTIIRGRQLRLIVSAHFLMRVRCVLHPFDGDYAHLVWLP